METKNDFLAHALSIPQLMEEVFWKIESDARQIVPTPEIYGTKKLYLFGCGDSYNAALGAAHAFAQLAQIDTRAVTSLQASRYESGNVLLSPQKNTLAVGISNSGEAARAVEAMAAFRANGYRTLAITADPDSRMAKQADRVLQVKTPPFISAPGVRGYVTAQISLYLLAIRFAEVKGAITMDHAGSLRKELYALGDILQRAFIENEPHIKAFAQLCTQAGQMELLGAGSARASADFGAAKVIEAVGINALSQDMEEFAHINFFRNAPQNIPTLLFMPENGRAAKRTREIIRILHSLGRPHLLITDRCDEQFGDIGGAVQLQSSIDEMFFPLAASCMVAVLAAHIEGETGNNYFRDHKGPWSEEGLPDIRKSEVLFS